MIGSGRIGGAIAAVGMAMAVATTGASPAAATSPPASSVFAADSGQCTASTRIADPPPAFDLLQTQQAWRVTRGAGVTVAVVDSGVAAANPHLDGAITGGVNLVDDDADPRGRSDAYGHGTAVAGIIAARLREGSGVQGLAPQARILPVRVYANVDDETAAAGRGPDIGRLADGIRYAADHGAQIINVSLSTVNADDRLRTAVEHATARGSLVVASAGNSDQTASIESTGQDDGPRFPAGDDGVVGVTATDSAGQVTDASIHGPHVALAAPGQNILSISPAGGDCIFAADAPSSSYAAAYASAAAALVAAAHPDETPAQWAYRLEATARRASPDAREDVSGWGVIQPASAITLVPGAGIRGPDSPFPTDAGTASPQPTATASALAVVTEAPVGEAVWAFTARVGIIALALLAAAAAVGMLRRRRPPENDGSDEGDDDRYAGGVTTGAGVRAATAGGVRAGSPARTASARRPGGR